MKKLFQFADAYIKEMDIGDFTLLKICLFAMGLLTGMCVSKQKKKPLGIIAGLAFVVTYILLMGKVFKLLPCKKIAKQ